MDLTNAQITAIISSSSAILGSVITLIVTHILKGVGGIVVRVASFDISFSKSNRVGEQTEAENRVDVEDVNLNFQIDFYNPTDVPKSLRLLLFEVKSQSKRKRVTLKPYVLKKYEQRDPSVISVGFANPYENLEILNLPPKEIVNKRIFGNISKLDTQIFQEPVVIFITGKSPNGGNFRKKLITYSPQQL